jgi:hypothetical protein
MKFKLINSGDPIWIPSDCVLYFPDTKCPKKYKTYNSPICAWYVEPIDDKWAKIMYENSYWSIDKNDIYPYPQE